MIDPSFGMPFERFGPAGSFASGAPAPAQGPFAGTLYSLPCVNGEWLRLLLGAAEQLMNPSTWDASLTDAQRVAVLQQADELRAQLGAGSACVNPVVGATLDNCVLWLHYADGTLSPVSNWQANFCNCVRACVPPPPSNPRNLPATQFACNLAGFLSQEIIQGSIQQIVNGINQSLDELKIATQVTGFLSQFGFVWTNGFVVAIADLYQEIVSGTLSHFTTAATDPVLESKLTCAIFAAISGSGGVTTGNFPVLVSNVCGLVYTYPDVIAAICQYVQNLDSGGLAALEVSGAYVDVDCSACTSGWCYRWGESTINQPAWQPIPNDVSGAGSFFSVEPPYIYSVQVGGSEQLHVFMPFTATYVTQIEVAYVCDDVAAGGSRKIGTSIIEQNLNSGSGGFNDFFAVNNTIHYIYFELDTKTPVAGHRNRITAVQISGTGNNPFGASNCV